MKKALLWVVGIIVLLAIIGSLGGDDNEPGTATTLAAVGTTEPRTTTTAGTATTAAATSTTAAATTTTTAPATTTAATAAPTTGSYTAGDYTFSDVQVEADFVDDFSLRARGTNNGPARSFVGLTATLFQGGSVVASLQAFVSDWAAGETLTIEFITTDDFGEWDAVEFQVDSES